MVYIFQVCNDRDVYTRQALNYCGKVSGKNADNKIKEAGLAPYFTDGTAGIEEADMIMVCKKMYHDEIKMCIRDRYRRSQEPPVEYPATENIRRKCLSISFIFRCV